MPGEFVTPDTTAYLALGLTVALGVLVLLLVSLVVRFNNLRAELTLIEDLERDERQGH